MVNVAKILLLKMCLDSVCFIFPIQDIESFSEAGIVCHPHFTQASSLSGQFIQCNLFCHFLGMIPNNIFSGSGGQNLAAMLDRLASK